MRADKLHDLSRRDFLGLMARLGVAGGGLAAAGLPGPFRFLPGSSGTAAASSGPLASAAPVARFWLPAADAAGCAGCHHTAMDDGEAHAHPDGLVLCLLCSHECALLPGERGRCRVRENVDGSLRTLSYGRPAAIHIDPIEKKPFYHFLPGSAAYSLGTAGCPLRCEFCQNWELSQARPEDFDRGGIAPDAIARAAVRSDAPVVAFTYNEPTVFFEYLNDIARRSGERGLRAVLVSCGFMNPAPLDEMCEVLQAVKIDLKGYSEDFYRRVCRAELAPVLRTLKGVRRNGVHLEIVNLVVPTLNDSDDDLRGLSRWVMGELGPDVPVHFTRFHPDYRLMNLPPTPISTLERAREAALEEGLHFPYVGNVPGHVGNHTYCPGCGKLLIERWGFSIRTMNLEGGRCDACETPIAGIWS